MDRAVKTAGRMPKGNAVNKEHLDRYRFCEWLAGALQLFEATRCPGR